MKVWNVRVGRCCVGVREIRVVAETKEAAEFFAARRAAESPYLIPLVKDDVFVYPDGTALVEEVPDAVRVTACATDDDEAEDDDAVED